MSWLSDLFGAGSGALAGASLGPWGALAGGALGLLGSHAAGSAASQQQNAAQQAIDTQWRMYQQNRDDLAPWRQGGANANNALLQALGLSNGGNYDPNAPLLHNFNAADFTANKDPGYEWRLNQGLGAVTNRASALGGRMGGNTLRGLNDYAQGQASQEFQNAFNRFNIGQTNQYNRLAGVAGMGENAAGQIAGLGANTAGNVGALQQAQGQYGAAGLLGGAQAVGGGFNNWLLAQALQNRLGGGSGMPSPNGGGALPYGDYTFDNVG